MPRAPRIQIPNLLFHVINRGNGRQNIFRSQKDYHEYLKLIQRFKEDHPLKLYHYVLMPNHVHFLLEPLEEGVISAFMQKLTLSHTRRFNAKYHSVGHVWQGRFKSILIETDEYYLECGRYIELNPVRAHIVNRPEQYPWTSYHHLALGKDDQLLDQHDLYVDFGKTSDTRQHKYTQFVMDELPSALKGQSMKFSERQLYGTTKFIETMREKFSIPILRNRSGRPPKNQT